MFNLNDYTKKVNLIKQKHKKVVTNIFFNNIELLKILSSQETNINYSEDYFIIFKQEQNFYRMFFTFGLDVDFAKILKDYVIEGKNNNSYIFELIDRETTINNLSAIFKNSGFIKYAELKRLRANKISIVNFEDNNLEIKFADENMVDDILELLYKTFDVYVSHLPNKLQLIDLIKNKLVFVAIKKDNIAGVICLENVGNNGKYLYQIMIDKKFRGQGISKKLASYAFEKYKDSSLFTSWVECNNNSSMVLHHELGFKEDGLVTVVFKNEE